MSWDPQATWDTTDVAKSLIAATATPNQNAGPFNELWRQVLPLLRWRSPVERAQSFRLAFPPVATVGGLPTVRRTLPEQPPIGAYQTFLPNVGPVLLVYAPPEMAHASWVRIRWGIGNVAPNELIAPYPRWGTSCDLVADQVQVDVFHDERAAITPPFNPESVPVYAATMGPPALGEQAPMYPFGFTELYAGGPNIGIPYPEGTPPPFTRGVCLCLEQQQAAPLTHIAEIRDYDGTVIQRWEVLTFQPPAMVYPWPSNGAALNMYVPEGAGDVSCYVSWRMAP